MNRPTMISKLTSILFSLPWLEILAEIWKTQQKLWRGLADEGMYAVLEYEATLELLNRSGRRAQFRKREKVQYQQDNIIAYQDQAWGDGQILLNYQCSPGVEVDRYRSGHKTQLLISLRNMKRRGDRDEFHIEWEMQDGFLNRHEQWETEISHRTRQAEIQIIFPQSRPPTQVTRFEYLQNRSSLLPEAARQQLADGRWAIRWQIDNPRLHERYILKWSW